VSKGMDRPVFTYKSTDVSYFCVGVIGLHAPITVVLAFSLPTTDALAEHTVCCSMAYNNEF